MRNLELPRLPWWAWGVALGSVAAMVNLVADPVSGAVDSGYYVAVFMVNIGLWLVICGIIAGLWWLIKKSAGRAG